MTNPCNATLYGWLKSAVQSHNAKNDGTGLCCAQLIAIIRLGRLQFLSMGLLLNLLGATIAIYAGASFKLHLFVLGQIVITFTQLMTHYANEYYDLEADRANQTPTNWSGGSRVLVNGEISPNIALNIAIGCATVAVIANIILSFIVFPHIITITLLTTAQLLSWFYSAPPLRLHSRGLGELSATLTVTGLTPITAYFLQINRIDQPILLAIVPLCLLQFAMLIAIEFPDETGDRAVNKRTLVVLFGPQPLAFFYCGLLIGAFAVIPLLVVAGFPREVALLLMLALPLALILIWKVYRGDWRKQTKWNELSFYTIVLLVSMLVLELTGYILLLGFL